MVQVEIQAGQIWSVFRRRLQDSVHRCCGPCHTSCPKLPAQIAVTPVHSPQCELLFAGWISSRKLPIAANALLDNTQPTSISCPRGRYGAAEPQEKSGPNKRFPGCKTYVSSRTLFGSN